MALFVKQKPQYLPPTSKFAIQCHFSLEICIKPIYWHPHCRCGTNFGSTSLHQMLKSRKHMWTASHVLLERVSIALPLYLCGCFKQPSRYWILTQKEFCGFYWCFEAALVIYRSLSRLCLIVLPHNIKTELILILCTSDTKHKVYLQDLTWDSKYWAPIKHNDC